MKVTLILVGRNKESWIETGLKDYKKRIKRYLPFDVIEVPTVKGSGKMTKNEIKEKEGKEILNNIRSNSYVVLLDENGKEYTSEEFAEWLQGAMNRSIQYLVFIIGGAYGFSDEIKNRANRKLSLSKMTFSHQIVRLVFGEQLYRALTIIKGEPYHHGN